MDLQEWPDGALDLLQYIRLHVRRYRDAGPETDIKRQCDPRQPGPSGDKTSEHEKAKHNGNNHPYQHRYPGRSIGGYIPNMRRNWLERLGQDGGIECHDQEKTDRYADQKAFGKSIDRIISVEERINRQCQEGCQPDTQVAAHG